MKVLFASVGTNELEISATPVEWEALSLALSQNGIEIPCDNVEDATPYSAALERIVISHFPGRKVELSVNDGSVLAIQGDRLLLMKLAESLHNFGRDFSRDSHIHVDYQGDNHFIGIESIPAVLCFH